MSAEQTTLHLYRMTSAADEHFPDWLDLFQKKFPLREQVLVSTFLRELAAGAESKLRILAILREEQFSGMACYELSEVANAGYLWYIAAEPEGQGIGSWAYREIQTEVRKELSDARALVFEVERPEDAHDEPSRILAERRIAFYERHGARLVKGIEYVQDVEWQPPMAMHLMIHPLVEALSNSDEKEILRGVFGEAVTFSSDIWRSNGRP